MSPSRRRVRDDKLARWVDLLAALLRRSAPATFEDLRGDIPSYNVSGTDKATVMRMFERDKDELRAAGIPIDTIEHAESETTSYRLRRAKFYLPYLELVGAPRPRRVRREGYQGLLPVQMSADDADLIAAAARRAEELGGPVASDARSLVKKLSVDIPGIADRSVPDAGVANYDRSDPQTLDVLAEAIRRRKRIEIVYGPIVPSDDHAKKGTRHVEGYGLFFLSGHWYLAGRDTDRNALRNFRVSRIEVKKVNAARPQTPDYEIARDFDLRTHARGRQAWELGDEQDSEIIVEIIRETAEALSSAKHGTAIAGEPSQRRFLVRRQDAFGRWLLSLAGDVRPVAPDRFVSEWRGLAEETLAQYKVKR